MAGCETSLRSRDYRYAGGTPRPAAGSRAYYLNLDGRLSSPPTGISGTAMTVTVP